MRVSGSTASMQSLLAAPPCLPLPPRHAAELIVDGGGTALPMLRQQDPKEYELPEEEEEGF